MRTVDAGRAEEWAPGTMRLFADARPPFILVRNGAGVFYAVSPRCPHQGVDLSAGKLTGACRPGAPGEYQWTDDVTHLRCPRHGYQFDVRTGQSWFDPAVRLRTFPVSVEQGRVLVRL